MEDYELPSWQFDKVLYIEKEGTWPPSSRPTSWARRNDLAVIFGKGYAVTACRTLLARNEFRDMTILVLHYADTDGYNIARTLGEVTAPARPPQHRGHRTGSTMARCTVLPSMS